MSKASKRAGMALAALLLTAGSGLADTTTQVVSGQTDLTVSGSYTAGVPTSASDVLFNGTYSPTTFTIGGSSTLNVATLDDTSATSLTINNGPSGASTLVLNGGTDGITGSQAGDLIYLSTGSLTIGNGSAGSLGVTVGAAGNFDVASTHTLTIASNIAINNALSIIGGGTVSLSGANTGTGGITISGGSNLTITGAGTNNSFGTGTIAINTGTITNNTSVSFTSNDNETWNNTVRFGGTTHTFTVGGNVSLLGNTSLSSANGMTVSGVISGSSNLSASNTVTLSGANTFSGTFTQTSGNIMLNNALALQNATYVPSSLGGVLLFNSSIVTTTLGVINTTGVYVFGGFSGAAGNTPTTALQLSGGTPITLAIGNNNASNSTAQQFTNSSTNAGSIWKIGTGTQTFTGASTYQGGTVIENGAVVAGVSNVGTTSGALGKSTAGITLGDANTTASNYNASLLNNGVTVSNNVTVANQATTGVYTIGGTNTTGTATYSGTVTLNQAVDLTAATGGVTDFTGAWTANSKAITVGSTGNAGTVQIDGSTITSSAVSLANGTLIENGQLNSNVSMASGTSLGGTGTVSGSVSTTGNNTISSAGTLTVGSGISVSGTGNTIGSGTTSGNVTFSGSSGAPAALNVTGTLAGTVNVSTFSTLSGTGSTGAVTLGGTNSAINLVKSTSTTGTLTVGGLGTTGGGSLTFAIGTTLGSIDSITDTGALVLGGSTTINIANLNNAASSTGISLVNTASNTSTNYLILSTAGISGSGTLTLSTTSLDGHNLSLFQSGNNYYLEVSSPSGVTPTSYTLATTAGATIVHVGGTTSLGTTLTNTGNSGADSIDYVAVGAATNLGSVTGGSTISGNLANNNTSVSNTSQTYNATTTGTATITSTDTSLTNHTNGGTPTGTPTGTTIFVYSGQSTWAGTASSGNWGSVASGFGSNWGANQGSPGLDTGFKGVDTATFGNVSGQAAVQVNLAGVNPNLNSITFNTPTPSATSYTIGGGSDTGAITLSGTTPSIAVTAGTHTIASSVVLGANTSVAVASGQQLTLSGQISDDGNTRSLSNTGAGKTILSSSTGNTYTGGTTISNGNVYVVNASGSGTGSGAVGVSSTGVLNLAHNGSVSGPITLTSGGTLYSGGVSTGTPSTGSGTGAVLTSALNVNGGDLTFALNNGGSGGSFASPLNSTTFITTTSSVNFTGTDAINLVDLSTGGLSLRMGQPYLLISAGSDSAFSGLVTVGANGVLALDGNGIVLGVWQGGALSNYTAITINELGANGSPLADATTADPGYYKPELVLYNGDLEVVPEPGTWALMIGGLALLVMIQKRRRNE